VIRERNELLRLLRSDDVGGVDLDNVVVCAVFRKVTLLKDVELRPASTC
jgi:hypothetical protein